MSTRADVKRKLGGARFRGSQINGLAGLNGNRDISTRDLVALGLIDGSGVIPQTRPATEGQAMGLPPFGRSVALLANAIASTPWYARRFDPTQGIYQRLPDQPQVVTNPDPLTTVWHYKWAVAEDAILYGNHFALPGDPDWRTGRPGWLVPIAADQVWIMTDPGNPGWYVWVIGGEEFEPEDLFHVPFGNRSGEILGRGVLAQYGDWLGGAVSAEEYSRDQFAAGALPPAVITTNQAATPDQARDLKNRWRELVSTREPVIFPNGTVLQPIVGNAQQAQLIEARTWNAQMCADAVGVPGWKLGLSGPSMTYQNIEDADIDWVRDSVDRFAQPFTQTVSKWLLPGGTELVWDYASRMRADANQTAQFLALLVQSGIITIDESRAALNRPPMAQVAPATAPPIEGNTTGNEDQAQEQAAQAGLSQLAQPLQITAGVES